MELYSKHFLDSRESEMHFIAKLAALARLYREDSARRTFEDPLAARFKMRFLEVNQRLFGKYVVDIYADVGGQSVIVEIKAVNTNWKKLEERLRRLSELFADKKPRLIAVVSRKESRQTINRISKYAEVWFVEDLCRELAEEALRLAMSEECLVSPSVGSSKRKSQ